MRSGRSNLKRRKSPRQDVVPVGGMALELVGNEPAGRRDPVPAGAGIGNRLDQQEEDLRQSMSNGTITNTGDRLIVTLPNDILFAVDDATVRPDLQRDLRALAGNLQAYPNSTVQIVGHTDSDGDAAYNLGLSQRRAQSVANVLVAAGVSGSRLQTIGRGEDQPVADNLTAQGKAQNRRVEIVILPNA